MGTATCDVTIIGAGPYGLSAATYLRTIKGLDVHVFGQPMCFWSSMPIGMLLRSNWTATQIADPEHSLTLEAYQKASGNHLSAPVPLDRFIEYGLWYQQQAVPDLDQRRIARVESSSAGFRVIVADGEVIRSRRVVVAAGIGSFAWRPPQFDTLPPSLASHTSQHRDLRHFAGQNVAVIGSGQSALESAALLHEAGAEVELIARSHRVRWLQGWISRMLHHRSATISRLLYAPTDVGPAGISQLVSRPELLKRLPRYLQDRLRKRAVRPAGARWLVARLCDVRLTLGRSIVSVGSVRGRVKVHLDDGSARMVDHVLLGTGYHVDVSQYDFLARQLVQGMHRSNGYPRLTRGFETSVPGLHILGAPAAWSFGPLMQFVAGTHYASRALVSLFSAGTRTAGRVVTPS